MRLGATEPGPIGSAVQVAGAAPPINGAPRWPKTFPPLTAEQQQISDDFMKYWHEVLPRRFGRIEKFNHGYVVRHAPAHFRRTLEIGAGLGEHLEHERLTVEQEREYYAVELRPNMAAAIQQRFPRIHALTGDCQQRLDFPDGFFDRILAVHVLEHLPDLPAAVRAAAARHHPGGLSCDPANEHEPDTTGKEVNTVALVAFLALVGITLWATGHLIVR